MANAGDVPPQITTLRGLARAEFGSPPGSIHGDASVHFDPFGQTNVDIVVRGMTPSDLPFGLLQLLTGAEPEGGEGKPVRMSLTAMRENACTVAHVDIPAGPFGPAGRLSLPLPNLRYTLGSDKASVHLNANGVEFH